MAERKKICCFWGVLTDFLIKNKFLKKSTWAKRMHLAGIEPAPLLSKSSALALDHRGKWVRVIPSRIGGSACAIKTFHFKFTKSIQINFLFETNKKYLIIAQIMAFEILIFNFSSSKIIKLRLFKGCPKIFARF